MAERLPRVTWAEIERAIRRGGWQLTRRGSRHDIYRHPDKPGRAVVLRHPSAIAKAGTLAGMLEAMGMSVEELRRLL